MIIAPVAAGTLWRMMLDRTYGVVNYLLSFVGIRPVSWLGDPHIALYTIVLVDCWQFIPFVAAARALLHQGDADELPRRRPGGRRLAMEGVLAHHPAHHLAGHHHRGDAALHRRVQDLRHDLRHDPGGPGNATEMLPTYIYRQGIKFLNIGYSSATAILFVIAMSVIAWAFQRLRDRQLMRLG